MEQAIHKLIDRHQHLEALLREASDEVVLAEKPARVAPLRPSLALAATASENSLHLSMDACLSCIQAQSHISGTPVPTVAAVECARELLQLQQTDFEQEKSTQCLMELIKRLTSQQLLNRALFIQELACQSRVKALPLELLWQLHACSAVPLEQYVGCNVGSPSVLKRLTQDITVLCSKVDVLEENSKLKKGVLGVLLRCGYSKSEDMFEVDERIVSATRGILESVVLELLKLQNQTVETVTVTDHHVAKLFETVRCNPCTDKDVIARFSTKQLQTLLQWNPDCDVMTAVARQHDRWTYAKAPPSITKMFTQLLLTIEEKQVCSVLRKVLEDEKVNWQHTLILVSVFCVCFRQGSLLIKDLVTNLLKESLGCCHLLILHAAFLLARQAAAQGSCDIPSYAQWFWDQFSSAASTHVTSSKTFTFFMEFLNSLVPHEPVHCLKAHIQHPPHIPYKCGEVFMDYTDLAKTRLADFKEGWQISNVSGPSTDQKVQTGKQLAIEDVELAVTTFEKTGHIHGRVLQSSIFRRPYYLGQFLPALLTPRLLPDTPDSKMKFIDGLKSADKIPSHMYKNYTEACTVELRMLLEGVSSEDLDDLAIEPMDRLQDCLDSLPHLLMKEPTQASYDADIAGHISLIAGRVTTVLEELGMASASVCNEGSMLLDVNGKDAMDPTVMKVIDKLLSCFCKAHILMVKALLPCTRLVYEHFTLVFASQGCLYHPLYHRLFTLICHQGGTLSEDHITGLASLLVHMSALGERLPHVKLQTQNKHRWTQQQHQEVEPDHVPLLNLICRNMHHRTGDAMKFTLKFCKAVLAIVAEFQESKHGQIIPQQLKQKFCYLLPRLVPTSRLEFVAVSGQSTSTPSTGCHPTVSGRSTNDVQEEVTNLLGTKGPLLHQDQLSFEDWLGMELNVHLCQDCLTQAQRKHYHHWILYTCYLPQLAQSSDGDNPTIAYKKAATIILHALLDQYAKPSRKPSDHCPHRARQGQAWQVEDGSCGCSSSCQDVVELLQELLRVWPTAVKQTTPSNDADCPWLLDEFESRLKTLSEPRSEVEGNSQELATALEVSNQMILTYCLPSHLLLTDSLSRIPSPTGVKHLTSYINKHLREHLQEDFCILGSETLTVILQGAWQMYTHIALSDSGQVQDVVVVMERLLQDCPLFTISVLRHWNILGPLISQPNVVSAHHQPRLFAKLNQLHAVVREVCSVESGTSLADKTKKLSWEPWVLVIAVFTSLTLLDGRVVSGEESNSLEGILINKFGEMFIEDELKRCLFEYHVAQTAWLMLTRPLMDPRIDVNCRAAAFVLSKQPSCLEACTDDTVFKRDLLQTSVTSLYPVVCFRILQHSSCHTVLHQASTDPQLLTAMLRLYTSLVRLHCQTDQPVKELPGYPTTGAQQVMDVEFLLSSLALLQRVLANSSSQTLASVDPTVLADTDPEVRSIVQRLRAR